MDYQNRFLIEYSKLNSDQKTAVDTIEGPVMVIAGPGTGKTQTIALRIANILDKTDISPSSILCLTFTDNASANMRTRLLSLIGPTAYSIPIHTFHSFCNQVIQTNPNKFQLTNFTCLEEVDKINIITKIIDTLPITSLLKPSGDPYYYLPYLLSSIQTLKREGFSCKLFNSHLQNIKKFIETNLTTFEKIKKLKVTNSLETDLLVNLKIILESSQTPEFLKKLFSEKYKLFTTGFYQKGKAKNPLINFKNDLYFTFNRISNNLSKQQELSMVFKKYQSSLHSNSYYDFDDMINLVVEEFSQDSDFLRNYQEQIQYILVDEFQDSNNSQINLLNLLSSFYNQPNIFVVGDDDQSIFRFQGASVENIINFFKKYQPKTIVLKDNYRSHQLNLDSAKDVISKNQLQLVNYIDNVDKNLIAKTLVEPCKINLFSASNPAQEAHLVVDKIKNLINRGEKPTDIVVLYRQHSDADLIETLLSNQNIAFSRVKNNLLKEPHIYYFLKILSLIQDPQDNFAIYSVLCLPFLKVKSTTLIKLLQSAKKNKLSLSEYLASKKLFSNKVKNIYKKITDCYKQSFNLPLNHLFVHILKKFSYLKYLSSLPNSFQLLSDFYSLFAYLKSFNLSSPSANLTDFMKRIKLLEKYNLSIPSLSFNESISGVNLSTVHGAKGLEYKYVFLINCLDKNWGNSQIRNPLPLPEGIIKNELSINQIEEDRRLFYVALTRTKYQTNISYSKFNLNGKSQIPSQFIYEINKDNIVDTTNPPQVTDTDLENLIIGSQKNPINNQNKNLILNYLKSSYKFNITHLNSYLNCPFCFFYKTILKIPLNKPPKSCLGTAIHTTLSYLYQNPHSNLKSLHQVFQKNLESEQLPTNEYQQMLCLGKNILENYLKSVPILTGNFLMEQNFYNDQIYLGDIPLTGKIDKIEILSTATNGKKDIIVTDFKTGKLNYTKIARKFDSTGGDYFRQILFYKLLLDLSPKRKYSFKAGQIEYLESDKPNNLLIKPIKFTHDDEKTLIELIKTVYSDIQNLKFPINSSCKNQDKLHQLL